MSCLSVRLYTYLTSDSTRHILVYNGHNMHFNIILSYVIGQSYLGPILDMKYKPHMGLQRLYEAHLHKMNI
jgi:hypothetical protein